MAVLLMAIAPDSASAVCHCIFHSVGAMLARKSEPMVTSTMVSATWSSPSPNTWRRMERSLGRLNSSPITNIKKTTPNSPR
jgi:hypothetical protein